MKIKKQEAKIIETLPTFEQGLKQGPRSRTLKTIISKTGTPESRIPKKEDL